MAHNLILAVRGLECLLLGHLCSYYAIMLYVSLHSIIYVLSSTLAAEPKGLAPFLDDN